MLKPWLLPNFVEAGCDEAGRGCLAGPVVAAAVILPKDFENQILDDSKKLKEKTRILLRSLIEKEALSFAIGVASVEEIDKINILNASFLAMHRAIEKLKISPEHLLIDGNRFKPYKNIPATTIVKGDGKYMAIAAASILAKTYRDELMRKLHLEFPLYYWNKNKGYGTKDHIAAIDEFGHCLHHRKTFHLKRQLKMNF